MSTLGNLLQRKGGTAKTGRTVELTLAIPDPKSGLPREETVSVLLLPVSEARKPLASTYAQAYIDSQRDLGTAPAYQDEIFLQFLCLAMRDPEDPRKAFVDSDNIAVFRESIVGEQILYLVREYATMIRSEFPQLVAGDVTELTSEAKSVFTSGPPSR